MNATPQEIEKRKRAVETFLRHVFNGNGRWISWKVTLNDDNSEDSTAFLVEMRNTTNKKKQVQILNVPDYGGLEILRGEDYEEIDAEDFLRWCFFDSWLTYPES